MQSTEGGACMGDKEETRQCAHLGPCNEEARGEWYFKRVKDMGQNGQLTAEQEKAWFNGKKVDCKLGDWTPWSECSKTCGPGGMKVRIRRPRTLPFHNGKECSRKAQFMENDCNHDKMCPTDCRWSAWSSWTDCSTSCGQGKQSRMRSIAEARSSDEAEPCLGEKVEERACVKGHHCPVDCVWSIWGPYSGCSVTCGGGVMTRTRTRMKDRAFGGLCCDGEPQESIACMDIPCMDSPGWVKPTQLPGIQGGPATSKLGSAGAAASGFFSFLFGR